MREPNDLQRLFFNLMLIERSRQDAKHGVNQNHNPAEWMSILSEEVGEAAMEANHIHWGKNLSTRNIKDYQDELVQTAAVALVALESFYRQCGLIVAEE